MPRESQKKNSSLRKTLLLIAPNFYEPTAWMISAYKTALALQKYTSMQVIVLTSQTKGSKAYEVIEGVKVYRSKAWYISDPFNYTITPFLLRDLKTIFQQWHPDAVLMSKYMFFPNLLAAFFLRWKNIPYVIQTDAFPGYDWFGGSWVLNTFIWIYTRTFGTFVLRGAKKIILLHEGLQKTAQELHLPFVIVHNGVDYDSFAQATPAPDLVKYKENHLLVTYLGRLDEVKGYRFVLEAAQQIHQQRLPVKFLFVCGDKYPQKRKQLAQAYPFIRFEGFRKDVAAIFKASDIHVLASTMEGLPNSILEAMAAGSLVISTPVGAVPYFLKDKQNGLLIEQSASSIVKAIQWLLRHPQQQKKIKVAAQETIKHFFSWKHLAQQLQEVLL